MHSRARDKPASQAMRPITLPASSQRAGLCPESRRVPQNTNPEHEPIQSDHETTDVEIVPPSLHPGEKSGAGPPDPAALEAQADRTGRGDSPDPVRHDTAMVPVLRDRPTNGNSSRTSV